MQKRIETFNKLDKLSNTLFGGFKQKGGNNNRPSSDFTEVTAPSSPGGQLLDSASTILRGSVKAADAFIPHSIIAEYWNPDLVNQPWSDVAPNLVNNIDQSGQLVSNAVQDPEVRKAVERAIAVYGEALQSVYGMAQPTIDDLTNKFWQTINDIGVKSARGATNATIDTISAAVAEIPMVGGLVDLFIAGGKWFNAIASGFIAPTVTAYGDVAGKAIYTGRESMAIGEKYGSEMSESYNDLSSALSNVSGGPKKRPPPPLPRARSQQNPGPYQPPSNQMEATPPPKPSMSDQARNMMNQSMSQATDMMNQAKSSKYGKAAMATGDYGKQLGKTSIRGAKMGMAAADGNYLTAARHGMGLGWDSAKLGYKGVKAARAVQKASKDTKKGGHNNPFMFGGGSKASKKKARKTSKRLMKTIERFTRKKR